MHPITGYQGEKPEEMIAALIVGDVCTLVVTPLLP